MYDLELGGVRLPTAVHDVSFAVGQGRPGQRDLKISIPIYGDASEADQRVAADRMRRQVAALLENRAMRDAGLYLRFAGDSDLNGWIVCEGGELAYSDGGPALGEYRLELANARRVGTARTHRAARRIRLGDYRTGLTPRDFLGRLYSTDFASETARAMHFLPVQVSDAIGTGRTYLTTSLRRTMFGNLGVLFDRPADEVVSFELPEGKLGAGVDAGGVGVYDRRPNLPTSPPRTNLLFNSAPRAAQAQGAITFWAPRAENDVDFQVVALTDSPTGFAFRLIRDTDGAGAQSVYAQGSQNLGRDISGRTYTAAILVRNTVAGRTVALQALCNDAAGAFIQTFSSSSVGVTVGFKLYTVTFTAPEGTQRLTLRWEVAAAAEGEVAGYAPIMQIVEEGAFGGWVDGGLLGFQYDGPDPRVSTSSGPYAHVNYSRNPISELTTYWQNGATTAESSLLERVKDWRKPPDHGDYALRYRAFQDAAGGGTIALRGDPGSPNASSLVYNTGRHKVFPGSTVRARFATNVIRQIVGAAKWRGDLVWARQDGTTISTVSGPLSSALGEQTIEVPASVAPAEAYSFYVRLLTVPAAAQPAGSAPEILLGDSTITIDDADTSLVHGDQPRATWTGKAHDSVSLLWKTSAELYGWDEVFGPTQDLAGDDVPVLENGLCRLRWVNDRSAFALDHFVGDSGYVEQGRFTFWREASGGVLAQYANPLTSPVGQMQRMSVAILEQTAERVVVRVTLGLFGSSRNGADVYLTLQRGWTGPRVELYTGIGGGLQTGALIRYSPAGLVGNAMHLVKGGAVLPWASDEVSWNGSNRGDFVGGTDPWAAVLRGDGFGPTFVLSPMRVTHILQTRDDSFAYGDLRKAVEYRDPYTGAAGAVGYCNLKADFVAFVGVPGVMEAIDPRWVRSPTASVVADAGALGSSAVLEDTQAGDINNTVLLTDPGALYFGGTLPGKLRAFAKVRVVNAGATGTVRFTGGATIATFTSQTYVWIDLGEVDFAALTTDPRVSVWRSAGTGAVRLARVVMLPVERRTELVSGDGTAPWDGARDAGEANLIDSRQELVLCPR